MPDTSAWPDRELNLLARLKGDGYDWEEIAAEVGRPAEACKEKFESVLLYLTEIDDKWTVDDVKTLIRLRGEGNKWTEIAEQVPRTAEACQRKFNDLLMHRDWKEEEVEKVRKMKQEGRNWLEISRALKGRSTVACSRKYYETNT